ncbi:MAG: hypothetical protein M4579_004358 [Chaenotheca gracillima]|nr:MAG: hypothetical protein M4579_004358 [Chaenotheca gracillima]
MRTSRCTPHADRVVFVSLLQFSNVRCSNRAPSQNVKRIANVREPTLTSQRDPPLEVQFSYSPFVTLSARPVVALTAPSSAVTRYDPAVSDEPHDLHDPETTLPLQRRRPHQQPLFEYIEPTRSLSSSDRNVPALRRTPRLDEQRPSRPRSASTGASQRRDREFLRKEQEQEQQQQQQQQQQEAQFERVFSEDLDSSSASRFSAGFRKRSSSQPPRSPPRSTRISRRTASAILYALEEAIRTPNPFTPDLIEEEASMSDLITAGASNPAGSNVRPTATSNGGGYNPSVGAGPGNPRYQATGVRTPSDIMRAREAKKRDHDARVREREEEENQRRLQEQKRRSYDRRAAAAAAGGPVAGDVGQRRSGGAAPPASAIQAQPERRQVDRPEDVARSGAVRAPIPASTQPRPSAQYQSRAPQGTTAAPPARPSQGQGTQPSTRPVTGTGPTSQAQAGVSAAPSTSQPTGAPQGAGQGADSSQPRDTNASSFPHAFERWEMLSSHWEGLTGHWIRRLEQNSDEVRREPLAQQMSRQITDLSAAGANLFHAVVELQRLRASSERKFQRWFFETRAEQERARELQGEIEGSLRRERQQRADAVQTLQRVTQEKENADKMVSEMRRELQISRDEARRAWEELGRMENLERERMASLKEGRPTLVGRIQVLPTIPGGVSRNDSVNRPATREGQQEIGALGEEGDYRHDQGYSEYAEGGRGVADDPFVETPRRPTRQEPDVPAMSGGRGAPPSTTNGVGTGSSTRTANPPQQPSPQPRGTPTSFAGAAITPTTALSSHVPRSASPGPTTSTSTSAPAPTAPFYRHEGESLQEPVGDPETRPFPEQGSGVGALSQPSGGVEYLLNERGEYRRDAQGRPIVYPPPAPRSEESDEYDVEEELARERAHRDRYGGGTAPPPAPPSYGARSGAGRGSAGWSTTEPPVDYSGTGWDMEIPRHHHPTRLSDVLEEDERSRTSPSRASMNSRR